MQFLTQSKALNTATDSLVIALFENQLTPSATALNQLTNNALSQFIEEKEISTQLGDITILRQLPNLNAKRVFVVGAGNKDKLSVKDYQKIYQNLWTALIKTPAKEVVSFLNELPLENRDLSWHFRFAVESIQNARYQYDEFKSEKVKEKHQLNSFIFHSEDKNAPTYLNQAIAIAQGVDACKNIANCPPNVCNPTYLSQQAQALSEKSPRLTLEVVGEEQMRALGMNAYLAVSQGSSNEAKMSLLHYRNHPNPNAKPIVLVGKGLTFDSGGISIKPSAEMDEMKYDMCGAASVFGVMTALAELNLPLNVIGVLAGCENMPDGNAYRPGDIIKTMNGLTVEILNTDAEGRLVLCDALTYVERFEPELIIDIATLTGACVVALGQHHSGLLSENDALAEALLTAGQETQDKVWRLPLTQEYRDQIKGRFGDILNVGGRWGGTSTAAAFLSHFTKNQSWAHLDIAGTAWLQGANKGATGSSVKLLIQFLINGVK